MVVSWFLVGVGCCNIRSTGLLGAVIFAFWCGGLVVGFVGFVFLVCFGFGFWVFVLLWLLFVGFFSFDSRSEFAVSVCVMHDWFGGGFLVFVLICCVAWLASLLSDFMWFVAVHALWVGLGYCCLAC